MSDNVAKSRSRERMSRLMKAARVKSSKQDEAPVEAVEYNWHEPHYFSRMQLLKLNDFVKKLMIGLSGRFSGFCRSEFEVFSASTTQHFAGEFIGSVSHSIAADYYLPFGADPEHLCGLVGLPEETALVWARQLLGDAESDKDSGKNLSQLEESLLLDLATALIQSFGRTCGALDLHPAGSIVKGIWPLELTTIEELCKITFSAKKAGSQDASIAYFLITSEMLKSVVGPTGQASGQFSANEVSRAILSHLQTMPVTVTAQLASTALTFGEVMNLRVDDILLLDKKADDLAELIIDGRTVYRGWPGKLAGKYALTIAPAAEETT